MVFLRILKESFLFALHALVVNKLRTVLSLLGITIGIFTIISVFSFADSLEKTIRSSIESMGSDVVYVQKMPWTGGGEWWKYFQRPEPSIQDFENLKKRATTAQNMAFAFNMRKTLKNGVNNVSNAAIMPVTHEYYNIWDLKFKEGRYFSSSESKSGTPVCVLGSAIAEGLFGFENPIGKKIKILGRKVRVIGVLETAGGGILTKEQDETVILPMNFVRGLMNTRNKQGAFVLVKAKPNVDVGQLKDELTGLLRSIRKLKPKADDNFALNESSLLSTGMDLVFGIIGIVGSVLGGFSILVGGFGIANIMFVSVRERTGQIGIQKSLGAKSYFILLQFLLESVMLCLIGGLIGLLLTAILLAVVAHLADVKLAMSLGNVVSGISISVSIGLISGFIPAYLASRLNPVEAIRSGM